MLKGKSKGFTLIELLVTILIIAIVAAIGIYTIVFSVNKSKEQGYKITINNIQEQGSNYFTEHSDKLFFVPKDNLTNNGEYQCVTVENLIDMGFFDEDIITTAVAKGENVAKDDYVYLERDDKTKALVVSKYVDVSVNDEYGSLCGSSVNAEGSVSFLVNPGGWSQSKEISINYNTKNVLDLSKVKYEYKYVLDGDTNSSYLVSDSTSKKINVTDNGTIYARIEGIVPETSLKITNIDRVRPVISMGSYTGLKTVIGNVTIPLVITENESGLNKNSFTYDDIEILIDDSVVNISRKLVYKSDSNGIFNYDLIISNIPNEYSGKLVLKIKDKGFNDNADNYNQDVLIDTGIEIVNKYTIKYSCGDGSGNAPQEQTVNYGSEITINSNGGSCSKPGYSFDKWIDPTNASWTGWSGIWEYENGQYGITNNVLTLSAQWIINNYYFDLNWTLDGSNFAGTTDTTAGLKINGVDQGYLSDYWKQLPYGSTWEIYGIKLNGKEISYSASGTVGASTTTHAVLINTLNIGVNNSSYGSVSATSLYVKKGTTYSTSASTLSLNDGRSITATTKGAAGYTTSFSNWSPASDTINSATTVTANFSRSVNYYTVSYNANGGSGSMSSINCTYGLTCTLSANTFTRDGYKFIGWGTSTTSGKVYDNNESFTYDRTNNLTLYAEWEVTEETVHGPRWACPINSSGTKTFSSYYITTCSENVCNYSSIDGRNSTGTVDKTILNSNYTDDNIINSACNYVNRYVTASVLNCRVGATTSSSVKTAVSRCTSVYVVPTQFTGEGSTTNWYYSTKLGCYLSGDYLSTTNPCSGSSSGGTTSCKYDCILNGVTSKTNCQNQIKNTYGYSYTFNQSTYDYDVDTGECYAFNQSSCPGSWVAFPTSGNCSCTYDCILNNVTSKTNCQNQIRNTYGYSYTFNQSTYDYDVDTGECYAFNQSDCPGSWYPASSVCS